MLSESDQNGIRIMDTWETTLPYPDKYYVVAFSEAEWPSKFYKIYEWTKEQELSAIIVGKEIWCKSLDDFTYLLLAWSD